MKDGLIRLLIMKGITVDELQIVEQGGENVTIKFEELSNDVPQGTIFEDTTHRIALKL